MNAPTSTTSRSADMRTRLDNLEAEAERARAQRGELSASQAETSATLETFMESCVRTLTAIEGENMRQVKALKKARKKIEALQAENVELAQAVARAVDALDNLGEL